MFEKVVLDIAEIKENQKTYQQEIQTLTKENQEQEERLRIVEKYVENAEKLERKNSIVIKGGKIQGNETSTDQYVEQLIKEKIGVQAKIQAARVVNEKNNIIVAKVESWDRKRTIMKQKSKLKGIEIFLDDDYTKKENEI